MKVNEKPPTTFPDFSNFDKTYYNFTTVNIKDTHQELQQRGVEVTKIIDHGAIFGFDFYDIDGNKFGVVVDK
ncbi:hypothetical protein ACFSTA_07870 [Ornithinibacillus salinisoli]|uniref:VOC domain-containing protein n=1 Tax=Ornithinibacillus salinisoli TaxID=1848459 RepID=A0ABW4VZS3_9BACI